MEAERIILQCEDPGRRNWCVLGMMTEIEYREVVVKEVCRHRLPEPLQIMIKSLAFYSDGNRNHSRVLGRRKSALNFHF